jgi:hypothetical protein
MIKSNLPKPLEVSRREFIRNVAMGSAVLASGALLDCGTSRARSGMGPTQLV